MPLKTTHSTIALTFILTWMGASVSIADGPKTDGQNDPTQNSSEEFAEAPAKLASKHLPNPVQIHSRVISGGLPEGDAAFQELKDLGVKTIISVDGMTPDVATAHKYGLHYVHLPHGYDGIPQQRVYELAKAVRELEGPIYVHCHHGKHRSPAAAATACVTAGLVNSDQAEAILKLAGTSPEYRGLFAAARNASRVEVKLLDQLQVEFREVAPLPPMAEAMVALEHTFERLTAIEKAGWKTPPDHPDLDAAHEALLLHEHFTELLRIDRSGHASSATFSAYLRHSQDAAQQMHEILKAATRDETSVTRLAELRTVLSHDCKGCHREFRDRPRGEK